LDQIDLKELGRRSLGSLIEDELLPDHVWFLSELETQIEVAVRIEAKTEDSPAVVSAQLRRVLEQLQIHINAENMVVFPLVLTGRGSEARESVRGLEDEHNDIESELCTARSLVLDRMGSGNEASDWEELRLLMVEFEGRMKRHTVIEYSVLFPRMLCGEDESVGE
jgi:regulator of cell morphogenesis and NO signaling